MKKELLLLSLAIIAITTFGQNSTPNGNFETWTSSTYDYPQNYPDNSNSQNFFNYHLPFNVTKTTDSYHGNYAVQLSTIADTTDTSFGYFLNINPNNAPSAWTGGMPYSQKPTGIRGYYKYNVATADSATIMVIFSKSGANIGTYFLNIGGIKNTYTLFDFILTPALSVTPDSVAFGALSCKFSNGQQQPHGPSGSTLLLDSVSFTGVNSQPALMNGDFELWQSQTYNSPANWNVQSDMGNGVSKTTDAKAGNYAVELKTYLGNQNNHPAAQSGRISTGYYPNNCGGNCHEQGGYPFSNQTDTLVFWYKYAPSGNDSASVNINFKKNGTTFNGRGMNLRTTATYLYKEIPFSIFQSPDSVMIDIQSSSWNDSLPSFVGSDLKIDEIHFKSQPLNAIIFNYKNDNSISIFPNPSNGKIEVRSEKSEMRNIEIYNVLGENVYSSIINSQSSIINLEVPKGIYFVKVYDDVQILTKKIVLQ